MSRSGSARRSATCRSRAGSTCSPGSRSETIVFPADDPARNVRLVTVYDRAERITSIKATRGSNPGTVLHHFTYGYTWPGTNGQQMLRTSETDELRSEITEYRYADPLERLTEVWRRASGSQTRLEDWEFFYDPASNVTRRRHNTSNRYFAYDANNRLCWANLGSGASNGCGSPPAGVSDTYDYDKAGNETLGTGGQTSTWNAANQLERLAIPGDANSPFDQLFSGVGQDDRLRSGGLDITRNKLGIAGTSGGSAPGQYTLAENGRLLTERSPTDAADRRAYLPDALGSTRTMINRNGDVVRRLNYDPWGEELPCPPGDQCGSAFARFRFAGGFTDGTKLYHFGERFYDSSIGRWTQQDTLDQSNDLRQANRYAYVGGDPINAIDPLGTSIVDSPFVRHLKRIGRSPFAKHVKSLGKRAVPFNGLVCYVRKSTADGDRNSFKDDTSEAINCLNPLSGYTGDVGGSDGVK